MDTDARKLNNQALYERRKLAVRLYKELQSIKKVAKLVGSTEKTVGNWIRTWKQDGLRTLKPKAAGRKKESGMRLSKLQQKQLQKIIVDRYPDQLKMDFALWTRKAVQCLIDIEFEIKMPIRTVGEYLKRWNFTPQKPIKRAYERSDKKVQKWLDEEFPEIKKKAALEGGEVHWGDETGCRSTDVNGRGYAPKGQTPVLKHQAKRESTNMISTVTNQGKIRFMFYDSKMNSAVLISFFKRLIKDAKKKVFLILDNLRVHHSKLVKDWVLKHNSKIELFYLPSYSPDLNPDEYLNCDLKSSMNRKASKRSKGHLKRKAQSCMRSLQRKPDRVRKYFKAETIRYAA